MTIVQAIIIGLIYFLFRFTQLGLTFSAPFFFSPLPMSFCVGLVLGDVSTAVMVGAQLQLIYLGLVSPGGSAPSDVAIAAMVGTSVALTTGMAPEMAVVLAVPAGLIGRQLNVLAYTINVACTHLGDKYAEEGSIKGVIMSGALLPNISKFLLTIPLVIVVYFGPTVAEAAMEAIPQWLLNGFATIGSIMPALGFAIMLNVIGKKQLMPYFAVGFLAVQYLDIPILPLAIFGAVMAFLHLTFTGKIGENAKKIEMDEESLADEKHLLTKKDVTKSYLMWWTFAESTHNYERLLGHSFCMAMTPIIKKLYTTKEDISAALQRHMVFFNTESVWGSVVVGITVAMEEQRAMGANVPDSAINGIKTGLMGPFAGIGDTLSYGTLLPIILALFVPLAKAGNPIAGIAPVLIFGILSLFIGLWLFRFGYKFGSKSALTLLKSGMFESIIMGASILGLLMIGGLVAEYVNVTTPLVITTGVGEYAIQDIFDSILKGLLPLLTLGGVYAFINKVSKNYVVAILLLFIIGIVLGGLGIIA